MDNDQDLIFLYVEEVPQHEATGWVAIADDRGELARVPVRMREQS